MGVAGHKRVGSNGQGGGMAEHAGSAGLGGPVCVWWLRVCKQSPCVGLCRPELCLPPPTSLCLTPGQPLALVINPPLCHTPFPHGDPHICLVPGSQKVNRALSTPPCAGHCTDTQRAGRMHEEVDECVRQMGEGLYVAYSGGGWGALGLDGQRDRWRAAGTGGDVMGQRCDGFSSWPLALSSPAPICPGLCPVSCRQHSAESGPVALHWCLHPVRTPVHRVLLESSGLDKPAGSRLLNQLLQRLPQISPSLGSKTLAGGAPCPSLHPKQPARQRD